MGAQTNEHRTETEATIRAHTTTQSYKQTTQHRSGETKKYAAFGFEPKWAAERARVGLPNERSFDWHGTGPMSK